MAAPLPLKLPLAPTLTSVDLKKLSGPVGGGEMPMLPERSVFAELVLDDCVRSTRLIVSRSPTEAAREPEVSGA